MGDGVLHLTADWERVIEDLFDRVEKFPRGLRYTLGQRIEDGALEIIELLVEAQFVRGDRRRRVLSDINRRLSRLRVLVRIAHRRQCIDNRGYEHVARQFEAFGNGVGAWTRTETGRPVQMEWIPDSSA